MQNVTGTQDPPGRLFTVIMPAVVLWVIMAPMVTVAPPAVSV
jgi:hypothetical protein